MAIIDIAALCRIAGVGYPIEFYDGPILAATAVSRSDDQTVVNFTLSGLEDQTDRLVMFWDAHNSGEVGGNMTSGNGAQTVSNLDPGLVYSFTCFGVSKATGQVNQNVLMFSSAPAAVDGGSIDALLSAIRTALAEDDTLRDYVETVAIGKWRADWVGLPAFTDYGIVVSPEGIRTETQGIRLKQHFVRVDVVVLATTTVGIHAARGILALVQDVYNCLNNNRLGGVIDFEGDELNQEGKLNTIPSAERDTFYHEVKMSGEWRLPPFAEA